jgi:hypothetical protein
MLITKGYAMGYEGPERRGKMDEADKGMLARIDERTTNILAALEKMATCERVEGLEGRFDRHLQSHDKKGNIVAQWVAILVAFCIGIVSVFEKRAP